ncbi:MAG TPA: hypothetical protein VF761_17240 [Gemmatimonadaceae bacterium]
MDIVQGVRIEVSTRGADRIAQVGRQIDDLTGKLSKLNGASLSGLNGALNAAAQAAAGILKTVTKVSEDVARSTSRMTQQAVREAQTSAKERARQETIVAKEAERTAKLQEAAAQRAAKEQERASARAAKAAEQAAKQAEAAEWRKLLAAERVAQRQARAAEEAAAAVKKAADAAAREQEKAAKKAADIIEREAARAAKAAAKEAEKQKKAAEEMAKATAAAARSLGNTTAGKGTPGGRDAIAEMGLSIKQLQSMSPTKAFNEVKNAIMQISDPTQRASMAIRIFGDEGRRLGPQLEFGVKELKILDAAARKAKEPVDELADALKRLGKSTNDLEKLEALRTLGLNPEQIIKGKPEAALVAIQMALRGVKDPAQRAQLAIALLGQAGKKMADEMNQGSAILKFFGQVLGGLFPGLIGGNILANLLTMAILKVIDAVKWLADKMIEAVKMGVTYNSFLRETELGIASLVMTYGKWIDAQGNVVASTRAFALSQVLAKDVLEQARVAALETTATFPEMTRALQEGMGPALQAGLNPDNIVKFTQAMTQAAGAIGLPFDQLGQEIRGVLEFDLSRNSRIARMLFQGMGKSADELRNQFNAMTASAKFDYLMEKLKAFSAAGEALARTPKGAMSNLKDAIEQMMGEGTTQLTKDFTEAVLQLSQSFLITGTNGKKAFDPTLIQAIKDAYKAVDEFGMQLLDLAETWAALNGQSIKFEGETTFERLADAVRQVTHDLRELMAMYKEFKELGPIERAMPWAPLTAAKRGEQRVAEEDEWLKGIADPNVAKYIAQHMESEDDRKWIRDNIGWLKKFQAGNMPEPAEGAGFNTSDVPDMYLPAGKPDNAETAQKILVTQKQVEAAQIQAQLAGTGNALARERLQLEIGILNASEKLAKSKIDIEKAEGSTAQKAAMTALAQQMADAEKTQARRGYELATERIAKQEADQVAAQREQLDLLRQQLGTAGELSALVKERVDHDARLASIEAERQAQRRSIDPYAGNKVELENLADETARVKVLQAEQQHHAVLEAITREIATQTATLERQAAQAEKNVEVTRAQVEAERLRSREIQTVADVQRIAQADRLAAEAEFQARRVELEAQAEQQIAEQRATAMASLKRLMTGNGTAEDIASIKTAQERIAAIQRTTAATIAADRAKLEGQISKIVIDAETNRIKVTNQLRGNQRAQQLAQAYSEAQTLAEVMRATAAEAQGAANMGLAVTAGAVATAAAASAAVFKAELEKLLKLLDKISSWWQTFAQNMANAVGTAFDTLSRGGKLSDVFKAIGDSFRTTMIDAVQAWINDYTSKLAFAAEGKDSNGNVIESGAGAMGSKEQKGALAKMGAAQVAQAGFSGYAAGRGNGQATMSAALAAFGTYASTGNIYVAIAAAIASLIGSALSAQAKQKDYKWGMPTFGANGRVDVYANKNILDSEREMMVSKFQNAVNDNWNSWVNILLKLPGANIPNISKLVPTANDPIRYVQERPSANFMKHWDEYLANDLPKYIAGKFKDSLKEAFTGAMESLTRGPITADVKKALGAQFEKFWTEAERLDQSTRKQFWSDMADGFVAFANAARRMENVNKALRNLGQTRFDENGDFKISGDSDFVSWLKAGTQGIYDQARAMVNLTGPERVAAFKALGQSVEGVTKALSEYIAHIADVLRQLKQSFHDARYQMDLHRAGEVRDANGNVIHEADRNAMARIMEAEYNRLMNRINNAAALGLTADEVAADTQRAMSILNDIYMLDPTEAAYEWWLAQMAALEAASTAALQELGDLARDAVTALIESLQPFVDWFNGLPVDLAAAQALLTGPAGAFAGFAEALADLTERVKETLPPGGGTTPPGGGIDPPGRDDDDGVRHQNLSTGGGFTAMSSAAVVDNSGGDTYNFYFGNVYGVDELQQVVTDAVQSVARNNPNKLRRDW